MTRVLGIDLGTTNSCVAVLESGTPLVVPVDKGNYLLPSVVAFSSDHKPLVGKVAKRQSVLHAESTFIATKRMMGLSFDDARVQQAMRGLPYPCTRGPSGDVRVVAHGRTYALPEIAAFILGELKRSAEAHFGEKYTEAVITVPAYFNDHQRQATRDAGQIAGLNVLRILNEPTAAALAYGALEAGKERRVVVYDLGGGTFDVSVLEVKPSAIEVKTSTGDAFLGGRDFDQRILDWLCARIESEHGVAVRSDKNALQRLWEAAEAAKIALSDVVTTKITLPFLMSGRDGAPLHIDYELTRETYEKLIGDLLDRTLEVFADAMVAAGLSPREVDEVILVGGMTRTPIVQARVQELTGKSPSQGVHPDLVVAVGAAIQGGQLLSEGPKTILLDVTPHNLGIMALAGMAETVIPKDTTIPTEAKKVFTTARDNQESVRIVVFQGDSRRINDNQILGEFVLTGLRQAPRGAVEIEVTFHISADGIVSVSARDLGTGLSQTIEIKERHTLPEEELMRMIGNHGEQLLAMMDTL